ncbi:hypothetical protein COL5a_004330 [Colletotrichum fioriniae]|nr:uncharacterized protein COL516b_005620 [Colletotrichum fioriniae]KAJ0304844.1 hypothetical protein COL516b_005620 [Colletotrichum fioriniae]KAJ0329101.1 hypothetical protein COL5a_004330 [Colletotrichum fioriniae]
MEGAIARYRRNGQVHAIKNNDGLPELIQLADTRLNPQVGPFTPDDSSDAYTFSGDNLIKVAVLNDPGNCIIVTLLKRCHRRYKNDQPLTNDSYFVGINATDFTPVFTRGVAMSSLKNNTYESTARTGSSMTLPCLIIPPVDMLRPYQLLFLKHLSRDQGYGSRFRTVSENEKALYKNQQQHAFAAGHACPLLVASAGTAPDYAAISDTRENKWRHFRMMMPKMEGRAIPKDLMEEIDGFLGKYDQDVVSPNLALILAIIYHDCYHALDLGAEKELKKPMKPVPLISLAQIILYGPHYFRIHEELKLAAYVHIFRAVDYFYSNDKKLGAFVINDEDINTDLVFKCIDEMALGEED